MTWTFLHALEFIFSTGLSKDLWILSFTLGISSLTVIDVANIFSYPQPACHPLNVLTILQPKT